MVGVKPKELPEIGAPVRIEWFDAHGGGHWTDISDLVLEPHDVVSIGVVVNIGKRAITIAQTADLNSLLIDNYLCCPWVNVVSITPLHT